VVARLHTYRNLGEDFAPEVKIMEKRDFGIDLKVELDTTTDPEEILADIYLAIENYLIPSIKFYSLEEMMDNHAEFTIDQACMDKLNDANFPETETAQLKSLLDVPYLGMPVFKQKVRAALSDELFQEFWPHIQFGAHRLNNADAIYLGPMLRHGFIETDELVRNKPRQTLYRSDLYQVIQGVTGVRGIEKLELYKLVDGKIPNDVQFTWCLSYDCRCLADLVIDKSTWTVKKGVVTTTIPGAKIQDVLELRQLDSRIMREGMLDLPVPMPKIVGDITEYTSLQEDFPRTYKIGRNGISRHETDLRKGQSKQLQGFLLFFDQILANYLAHLRQVREVLSIDKQTGNLDHSMYQPIYDVPGIENLLVAFEPNPQPHTNTNEKWEHFKSDPDNDYRKALDELITGSSTQRRLRRNAILDHLLARFGEQFTDYILGLYEIERPIDSKALLEGNLNDWISDKQSFLKMLPDLSAKRAQSFNYRIKPQKDATHFWNSSNVEGLKRRVCALLGMSDASRHTITCEPGFFLGVEQAVSRAGAKSKGRYEFWIKEHKDSTVRLLISTNKFTTLEGAQRACQDFLNYASDTTKYGIEKNERLVGFWLEKDESKRTKENALLLERPVALQTEIPSPERRLERIRQLAIANCQDDSFHIVEHILLRPRSGAFTKPLASMTFDLEYPEWLDPYSYAISIVVPSWMERFKDERLFAHFEQTLRSEAPAHLAISIIKLDRQEMLEFETVFYDWLNALTSKDQQDLPATTDKLVDKLNAKFDKKTL